MLLRSSKTGLIRKGMTLTVAPSGDTNLCAVTALDMYFSVRKQLDPAFMYTRQWYNAV